MSNKAPAAAASDRSRSGSIQINTGARRAMLVTAALAIIGFSVFAAKWNFANMAAMRTDRLEIAEFAVGLGPSDSQTHYTHATMLEKTFLPEDFSQALREYETAAALSPSNYLLWVDLGKARE